MLILTLTVNLIGCSASSSNEPTTEASFNEEEIIDWYINSQMWRTVENGHWSNDPLDKISDEELEKILTMAMHQQSAVQWTPWYFIAVKDVEEQRKILGDKWGAPEDLATEGTVTVLVMADQILSEEEGHTTPFEGTYMHAPHYAYFDSGAASALLHIGAASLGYQTHYFGSINGEYAPFDLADGRYQSMSRYIKEDYKRAWGYMAGEYGGELNESFIYPVEGNAVLVMAIVIGKPEVDVVSSSTNKARPNNWSIWE